jgi:hypothetical protein
VKHAGITPGLLSEFVRGELRVRSSCTPGNQTVPRDVGTVLFSGVEGYHFKHAPLATSSSRRWRARSVGS